MLSALLVGPLFAGLAVLALSVTHEPSIINQPMSSVAAGTQTSGPVRLSLDLSRAQPAAPKLLTPVEPERAPPGEIAEALNLPNRTGAKLEPATFRNAVLSDLTSRPASRRGKVAIIIDDLGHNARHNRGALSLPRQVAFALLPYTRLSKKLAKTAAAEGHELIVHMPMQPKSSVANAGPHALLTSAEEAELRQVIAWNLEQFDGYYAVNNHMGSRFTEHEASMRILFEELAARGLSFYDSRTTASSSAVALAASFGVSLAERDVFLDNEQEAVAVDRQLATLEKLAQRNGSAIAIGHPHQVTFEQIRTWAATLDGKGLVLVKPSVIMAERRTPYWRSIVRTAQSAAPSRQTY